MIYVTKLALCTPLGLSAAATVRACAAGISRVSAIDDHPTSIAASRLSTLPLHLHREERMLALFQGCLAQVTADLPALSRPVPCFLALPEPGTGASFDLQRWLADLRRCPEARWLGVSPARSMLMGRAGLFTALEAAGMHLAEHGGLALVGAADCASDPYSLKLLAEAQRLLGERNPDGLVPGEAAGVMVLAGKRALVEQGLVPLASIPAVVRAEETEIARSAYTVAALTEVFRGLRLHPALGGQRVERVLSCQPETQRWAQEFSAAYLRNPALMPEPMDRRGLTRTLGDVGAAAGVVQLAMALDALHPLPWRPRTPLARLLVYGASDGGSCGGCLVTS